MSFRTNFALPATILRIDSHEILCFYQLIPSIYEDFLNLERKANQIDFNETNSVVIFSLIIRGFLTFFIRVARFSVDRYF